MATTPLIEKPQHRTREKPEDNGKGVAEKHQCDVLVVGSGIIGLSTAYRIKKSNPGLSVLVIERANAAVQGETAKSTGAFRDCFTSEVNRLLARSSIEFYKHLQFDLGFNLKLELIGYLWLLTRSQLQEFEFVEEEMRSQGISLRTYERSDLQEMMPGLVLDPASEQSKLIGLKAVHKGIQGLNCGTLAPELLSKFYESELRKLGGEFQFGTVVKSLRLEPKNPLDLPGEPFAWQEKVFTGVETDRGFVAADTIVLAAGLETPFLLDAVGVDCLTKPKKRQVFRIRGEAVERLLAVKGFNDQNTMPFTFLPIGDIHFRPVLGERSFWVGAGDNLGRRFHLEKEATAEESFYTYSICPILSEYFPCFAGVRPASSWAGHYDVNSLDGTPVIQRLSNCILIAGMSGSGIMKADGIGRVAEAAFEGKSEAQLYDGSTIEVSRLGLTNRAVGKEKFVL